MSENRELKQRIKQFAIVNDSLRVDSYDQNTAEWGWGYYFGFKDWLDLKNYPREVVSMAEEEMGWEFGRFGRRFKEDVWERAKTNALHGRRLICG